MKRAQITAFILLGVVVISVFGGVFAFVQSTSNQQIKEQINALTTDLLQTTALEYYINSCIEEALNEALITIGLQGGMLYDEQVSGLPIVESPGYEKFKGSGNHYIEVDGMKINYGLFQPQLTIDTKYGVYQPKTKIKDIRSFKTAYGLPKVCSASGPNHKDSLIPCSTENRYVYAVGKQLHMQGFLARYISDKVQSCVEFTKFENNFNYNLTEEGEPNVIIVYGDDDIVAKVSYPLTFTFENQAPEKKFMNFSSKKNVRFKQLFELTASVLNSEIKLKNNTLEENYKKFNDTRSRSLWDSSIILSRSDNVLCSNCKIGHGKGDYLVTVTDLESFVKAQELTLQFAVKNRVPILDLIQTTKIGGAWDKEGVDIVSRPDKWLRIEPRALDLDEDNLTFGINGWLVDYNETWNNVTKTNIKHMYSPTTNPKPDKLEWDFNQETGVAELYVKKKHTGWHEVKITVNDSVGLYDWQIVRIFIPPKPIAKAFGSNIYDDIDNNYASVEDPYILDGEDSVVWSPVGEFKYKWKDLIEPTDYEGIKVTVPPEYDITKMENLHFTLTLDKDPFYRVHKIELTVENPELSFPVKDTLEEVRVYECLPHRNESPSYPFIKQTPEYASLDEYADFRGNHTCCLNTLQEDGGLKNKIYILTKGVLVDELSNLKEYLVDEGFIVKIDKDLDLNLAETYDQIWVIVNDSVSESTDVKNLYDADKPMAVFLSYDKFSSGQGFLKDSLDLLPKQMIINKGCPNGNPIFLVNQDLGDGVSLGSSKYVKFRIQNSALSLYNTIVEDSQPDPACNKKKYVIADKSKKFLIDGSYHKMINSHWKNDMKKYFSNIANWMAGISSEPGVYGKIADDDHVCYDDNVPYCYGSDALESPMKFAINKLNINEPDVPKDNHIYERVFQQNCSGNRGNLCDGKIAYEFKEIHNCGGLTNGEDEHCRGPPDDSSCSGCEDYPAGTTFETTFGISGANGICNENEMSSTSSIYNKGGPLKCQAKCNGAGSCSQSVNCKCVGGPCNDLSADGTASKPDGTTCRNCVEVDYDHSTYHNKCAIKYKVIDGKCCGDDLGETPTRISPTVEKCM